MVIWFHSIIEGESGGVLLIAVFASDSKENTIVYDANGVALDVMCLMMARCNEVHGHWLFDHVEKNSKTQVN
jgi:hypothetical protein